MAVEPAWPAQQRHEREFYLNAKVASAGCARQPDCPISSISYADAQDGQAEKMGLGIVSKKAASAYRSGPSKLWLRTKCWTESELTLIGFDKDSKGVPIALLAREYAGVLVYAGAAFVGMPPEVRERVKGLREIVRAPVAGTGRKKATWLEPTLRLKMRHLRGDEGTFLRHASVKGLADG